MATVAVGLAVPATAQSFVAENRVAVTGAGQQITLSEDGGFGARGMWCAAADYARRVLGAGETARLRVERPRSTPRGPVTFALGAPERGTFSVMIVGTSLRQKGANLSVGHAFSFCADAKIIDR